MAKSYLDKDGLLYFLQQIRPNATPQMDGTASTGTAKRFANQDHVHPSDTTKADKSSTVTSVSYNSTNNKITKTINGTTSDVVTLSTVATSGSYNDLSNKPTIPSGVEKSTTTPKMDGTASVGSETKFAAGDHVHPSDSTKVDKETGKGLSTNDYTTAEKNKLGEIEAGAEVNQNAFSSIKVGSTTVAADTKTDTLELVAGTNVTLTPDATDDKVTIAASHPTYTQFTGEPITTPSLGFGSTFTISQISQSTAGQVSGTSRTIKIPDTVVSSGTNGLMTSADKQKLDNISGQTLDLVAGSNITLTPDTTNGSLTIAATNTTYTSGTSTELSNGTVTSTRVWTPKILHDYVAGAIETAVTGAVAYQGVAPTTFAPTNYTAGWYWIVGTAGTYCGQVCEAGDMIFCKTAGTTYSASDFDVVQTNLDITSITNTEIDTIVAS